MNFKEILLSTMTGVIETVGESKLIDALQQLHDKHPEEFEGRLKTLHGLLLWLQPVVKQSPNKIDDAFLNGFIEAVAASASANNITL